MNDYKRQSDQSEISKTINKKADIEMVSRYKNESADDFNQIREWLTSLTTQVNVIQNANDESRFLYKLQKQLY